MLLQVHDEFAIGRGPVDASVDHGARVLGGLLQLGPEPAHLRVLQPGVPGGVPEDFAELLAQIAAVVSAVHAPPVRARAQRHGHADRGVRLPKRVQQQRVRGALREPGDHCAAPEQRWRRQRQRQRKRRISHRTERSLNERKIITAFSIFETYRTSK